MKKYIIIQARENSMRLPNKVLLPIGVSCTPMLVAIYDRCRRAKVDAVIVATGTKDTRIINTCNTYNMKCYAGSSDDVLQRYINAAHAYDIAADDIVVRITADCPCVQPELIDQLIEAHLKSSADITCNVYPPTYPDGYDTEVFYAKTLFKLAIEADNLGEKKYREHLTLSAYGSDQFSIQNIAAETDMQEYRLTVDYIEDYARICRLYHVLGSIFGLKEVENYLASNDGFKNTGYKRNESCEIVKS